MLSLLLHLLLPLLCAHLLSLQVTTAQPPIQVSHDQPAQLLLLSASDPGQDKLTLLPSPPTTHPTGLHTAHHTGRPDLLTHFAPTHEQQLQAIHSAIASPTPPDAILLDPLSATGWDAALAAAHRAKLLIIVLGPQLEFLPSSTPTFPLPQRIICDEIAAGRLIADHIATLYPGPATLIELQGTPGFTQTLDRQQGLMEGLAKHRNLKLIRTTNTYNSPSRTSDYLSTYFENPAATIPTCIIAHTQAAALAAADFLRQREIQPPPAIFSLSRQPLFPSDPSPLAQALRHRHITAAVTFSPTIEQAARTLLAQYRAGSPPTPVTTLSPHLVQPADFPQPSDTQPNSTPKPAPSSPPAQPTQPRPTDAPPR